MTPQQIQQAETLRRQIARQFWVMARELGGEHVDVELLPDHSIPFTYAYRVVLCGRNRGVQFSISENAPAVDTAALAIRMICAKMAEHAVQRAEELLQRRP